MTVAVIVTICVGMGLVLTAVAVSPVTLKLFDRSDNWIHVNFYEDDFLKFTLCMKTIDALSCTADLTRDKKHPNEEDDMKVLTVDKPNILHLSKAHSRVFTCQASLTKQQLVCERLPANFSLCDTTQARTEYFRLVNGTTSSSRCVGVRFRFMNESLLFDPFSNNIEMCNISCNAATENQHSSKPDQYTLSPHPTVSEETAERTSWSNKTNDHTYFPFHHHREDDDDDDKSHIIIAAVVSMVVTSSLIISGFLFRRHILGMKRHPNTQVEYLARNPIKDNTNNNTNSHQEKALPTNETSTGSSDLSLSVV